MKKPAESAKDYLEAEDKRLRAELAKVIEVLKQGLYPEGVPRALSYPLAQEVSKQYCAKEKEATLFWGQYEVAEVRSMRRTDGDGYVGAFTSNF